MAGAKFKELLYQCKRVKLSPVTDDACRAGLVIRPCGAGGRGQKVWQGEGGVSYF